jgi:hypothetical protein
MSRKPGNKRNLPAAARVFADLQADESLLPGGTSALRRTGALFFMFLVLAGTPLYLAANAAGLIGDQPVALAKSGHSGPGGDDDGSSGPGGGDDDDDDSVAGEGARGTDDTSANGHSTRGTTNDNDTQTRLGTDDTSRNGHSTRGTTNDNDTHTRTQGQAQTRTGS